MCPKTSPAFSIRDSQRGDHDAIADIYSFWIRQGGATMDTVTKTAADIDAMVAAFDDRECILVIEESDVVAGSATGEGILGWGIVKRYSDRLGYRVACETSVYLRPGVERRGFGSAMKRALIERCRQYRYHHLVAKIWADNQASIDYNRKLGYEVVGVQRQVGHCHGKWRDICLMQLVLEDVPVYREQLSWPGGSKRGDSS